MELENDADRLLFMDGINQTKCSRLAYRIYAEGGGPFSPASTT